MTGPQVFESWLGAYGRAWEAQDSHGFTRLFATDALYCWTPFEAALKGRDAIADAFKAATGRQRRISFSYRILSVDGDLGVAHWTCDITRATSGRRYRIDGVLTARLDADGRCGEFREWWHSNEHLALEDAGTSAA